MKREEFNALITRNDAVGMHAIGRALVHLFRRQTEDEQESNSTRHDNQRGFTSSDARRGSITAKYYRQIAEEARKKSVAKAAA